MWLKLCFLLLYVLLLFVLARLLEALAWCELGLPGLPSCSSHSCRLMDPVLLSVVQLKALLDQRGLSYEGVVEKSELTELVSASGQVSVEDAERSQMEDLTEVETNFTSGAHFIEQVEDAKDSVWLVQVSGNSQQHNGGPRLLGDSRWKNLKRKMMKFGVRMGHLDCSLDTKYCHLKGWNSNFVLLALPSQHQKKASVALYNFSGSLMRETTLLRWVRNRLNEKIYHVTDMEDFKLHWQYLGMTNPLEPEVRVVLFTSTQTTPLFYSALSVKFPGRVKFGLVSLDPSSDHFFNWIRVLNQSKITELPAYMIYTAESNYTYGVRHGEPYSFIGMERFLKSLYPCLNDIFIISFCLANAISWLELFVSNCSLIKRFKKFAWCVFKFNLMVILLWLPIIGIFQMPYLDRFPLIALKCVRILSISSIGQMLRGDYNYYVNHPALFFVTLATFLTVLTLLCKRYRSEELDREDDWFNFSQMRTLTHLRPNDFFEPMRVGGYDLFGGLDVFGSRLSQPSLWLPPPISPEYIQHLPTWKFHPISIAEQALVNAKAVEATLLSEASSASSHDGFSTRKGCSPKACPTTTTTRNSTFLASPHQSTTNGKSQNPTVRSMTLDACTVCAHGSQLSKTLTKSPRTSNSHFLGEEQVQHGKTKTDTETLPDRMIGQSHNSLPSSNPSLGVASPLATAFSPNSHTSSISPSVMPSTCSRNHHQFNSPRAHCPGDHNPGPQASGSTTESLSPGLPLPLDNQFNDDPSHSESVKMACSPGYQRARRFPVGYLENYQCVICLEEYAPLTSLCGLPCGHVFHETCIISWLNRDKHFCPMCRWPSYRPQPSHCQAH